MPSGAEAPSFAIAPTGLSHQCFLEIPTLKRGANKHCAYGAIGTNEFVPFKTFRSRF